MNRFYNDLEEQYEIEAAKKLAEKEIILNLSGMDSTDSIEQAVKGLPGVKQAATRMEDKQIKITYLPEQVDLEQIKEAIQEEGCQIINRLD